MEYRIARKKSKDKAIFDIQWNSVNKSTSGQPVLDLICGGFNKRRFLKMHLTIVDIPLER